MINQLRKKKKKLKNSNDYSRFSWESYRTVKMKIINSSKSKWLRQRQPKKKPQLKNKS